MAREYGSHRDASRRPTSSRAPAGSRRPTGCGPAMGRRPPTARGRAMAGGRPTTRAGQPVRRTERSGLLIGGIVAGVLGVVVLVAVAASSGGAKARTGPEPKPSVSLIDATPRGTSAPVRVESANPAARKPLEAKLVKPRQPASYYKQFVDPALWEEAKGYAREAETLLADIERGKLPPGLTKNEARKRAKDLLCQAAEKGAEFMSPLDDRREEAEHFIIPYETEIVRWQRKTRGLLFGSKD